MLKAFKVTGNSLFPFYKDGERVLCVKKFKLTTIKLNNIVVFSKEAHGRMIKRVTKITDNKYFVEGTDPLSIDSRNFGAIDLDEIEYKVLFKF